jgi:UDP-N-acetylmuramyl pentapeptide phosphotransferase/UDP-N-acetylglucosamine-1-phosphate transferase
MLLASASALSFLIAFLAVRILLVRFAGFALDRPNERSLHDRPVPRTGGLAILAGTVAASAFIGAEAWLPMLLALVLGAISLYDDVHGLPNRARLTVHVAAAAVLVWWLGPPHPLVGVVLVIAVVWITNLYNFMDGADGVAGGMAVIGFGTYALAALLAQHMVLAALCGAIAAGSAAFLLHNFHPARIFLGDVGSIPLGFLAAGLGLAGWREGLWPLWFPLLVFGPFNADATVTLVRRLARGDKVWRPHREHYYQRIVRMGLGHRAAALMGYAVMACCAAAALVGRAQPPALQAAAFAGGAVVLAAMAVWVDLRWTHFAKDS